MEMTNRFKGFDMIDRVPDELWMEVPDIVQESLTVRLLFKLLFTQRLGG